MAERRSWIDRVMRRQSPSPVRGLTPPPRTITENVWSLDRRIAMRGGLSLPARCTVVRLPSGALWVHSPVHLDAETREALTALGPVRHVVAPNSFHYVFVTQYPEAFPEVGVYVAPGLPERCPELPPATVLGAEPPTAWEGVFDSAVFGPVRGLSEVAFLHRPSATLILTDLSFYVTSAETLVERLMWQVSGVWHRFGPSLTTKMTLLRDRAAARAFAERVLEWKFERIVVAHGDVLESGSRDAFGRAFARYLG